MFDMTTTSDMDMPTMIVISGEIDLFAAPDFKTRLYESVGNGEVDVILDCAQLDYIDSTGPGILLGVLKKVRQNSHQVTIRNLKENVRKLFRITGLDKAFIVEEAK